MSYDNPYRSSYVSRPPSERTQSGLGIAAFLLGLASAGLEFALIVVAVMMEMSSPGGMDEESPQAILLGLGLIGGLGLAALGGVAGLVALLDTRRSKTFAVLGVAISAMVLLGIVLLWVIGTVSAAA